MCVCECVCVCVCVLGCVGGADEGGAAVNRGHCRDLSHHRAGARYIYIPHGDKHSEGVLSLELAGESDQLPQPTAATPSEGIIEHSVASSGLQTPHVSTPLPFILQQLLNHEQNLHLDDLV